MFEAQYHPHLTCSQAATAVVAVATFADFVTTVATFADFVTATVVADNKLVVILSGLLVRLLCVQLLFVLAVVLLDGSCGMSNQIRTCMATQGNSYRLLRQAARCP
jgi:hypothetical protein